MRRSNERGSVRCRAEMEQARGGLVHEQVEEPDFVPVMHGQDMLHHAPGAGSGAVLIPDPDFFRGDTAMKKKLSSNKLNS